MTANWVLQILTSGVTGGIAGGLVNQGMTWWRESRAIKIKTQYERAFIAVDLIFRLERLAEQCALIVNDSGELDTISDSDELHEFADIGLRAMYINRRLRTLCAMPESRLVGTNWSVWSVLKRMSIEARLERYRNWHKEKYAIPEDNDFRL